MELETVPSHRFLQEDMPTLSRLGHVAAAMKPSRGRTPTNPRIPFRLEQYALFGTRQYVDALRWMEKKVALNQDIFLVGGAGPLKRWLALHFCALTGREVEYVALTRDTTESDLKQRRELVSGGTSVFTDQPVVRAALKGRVLIIEGLEKTERNVLPVINNLLENREMALEDGSFLCAPHRYDDLCTATTQLELKNLLRVSEHFRVIAIGLPVPPFPGNPLDPPLRSRFQARRVGYVPPPDITLAIRKLYSPSVGVLRSVRLVVAFAEALRAVGRSQSALASTEGRATAYRHLPYIGERGLLSAARLLSLFPRLSARTVSLLVYPHPHSVQSEDARHLVGTILRATFPSSDLSDIPIVGESFPAYIHNNGARRICGEDWTAAVRKTLSTCLSEDLWAINEKLLRARAAMLRFACCPLKDARAETLVPVWVGDHFVPSHVSGLADPVSRDFESHELSPDQRLVLTGMLQSHASHTDICLLGGKGAGKSFVVGAFARALGYEPIEPIFLFKDMCARDILQRRTTDADGRTIWMNTPLIDAMIYGRVAVLDGLHRLPPGTISVLARLFEDRELSLFDGSLFLRYDRYLVLSASHSAEELAAQGVFPIHPAFRVVATASFPSVQDPWLTNEILHYFHFHKIHMENPSLAPPTPDNRREQTSRTTELLGRVVPECPLPLLGRLARFAAAMELLSRDPIVQLKDPLSLRQLIRVARRCGRWGSSLMDTYQALASSMLLRFVPVEKRDVILQVMHEEDLAPSFRELRAVEQAEVKALPIVVEGVAPCEVLRVGEVRVELPEWPSVEHPELVPDVLFFDVPNHTHILQAMLQDFVLGEHLLLLGNQGVGKNKLVDRMLQLLRREREYIQLHRDTTVQVLTLSPSLREGVVVWEDSPLVKALRCGRVLIVDEVDKAPTEVVCVLKALLADGEILLSDGRRFITPLSPLYRSLRIFDRASSSSFHKAHPAFRVIALGNRPGYPFLGNDFFAEMGDVFACQSIGNPDQASEVLLLRSYAPSVPVDVLNRLTAAFQDLRNLTQEGILTYPYSTRELVAIVRHMEKFPRDNINAVLQNVFAFDSFDDELLKSLHEVFHRHGIPLLPSSSIPAGASSRTDSPTICLAEELPLPPLRCVGSVQKESLSPWDVEVKTTGEHLIPPYRPPGYRRPIPLSRARRREKSRERDEGLKRLKDGSHNVKTPSPSENWAGSEGVAMKQRALARAEHWAVLEDRFSARAVQFTEEQFHFAVKNTGAAVHVVSSSNKSHPSGSDTYLHVLTSGPCELVTFDVTQTKGNVRMARMELTPFLANYCNNDQFEPPPCLAAVNVAILPDLADSEPSASPTCSSASSSMGELALVYWAQYNALMVCNPLGLYGAETPGEVEDVFSLVLDVERERSDGDLVHISSVHKPIMRVSPSSLGEPDVVALYLKGKTRLALLWVQLGTDETSGESHVRVPCQLVDLPRSFALGEVHWMERDVLYISSLRGEALHMHFGPLPATEVTIYRSHWKDVEVVSDDPIDVVPQLLLPIASSSLCVPNDPTLREGRGSQFGEQEEPLVAPFNPSSASYLTAFGEGTTAGAAGAEDCVASSRPSHVFTRDPRRSSLALGLLASSDPTSSPARVDVYVCDTPASAGDPVAELPAEESAPNKAEIGGRTTRPRPAAEKCVPLCLQRSGAPLLVRISSFKSDVLLELILVPDLGRDGSYRRVLVATKRHHQRFTAAFDSTSDSLSRVPAVVDATELGDGRLALLHADGRVRIFEVRPSKLQEELRGWLTMQGGNIASDGAVGGPAARPAEGEDDADIDSVFHVLTVEEEERDDPITPSGKGRTDAGEGGEGGGGSGDAGGEGDGGVGGGGTDGEGSGRGGGGGGGNVLHNTDFNIESAHSGALHRVRDGTFPGAEMKETEVQRIVRNALRATEGVKAKELSAEDRVDLGQDMYERLFRSVSKEISQLRVILEGVEAKERERVWVKNQTVGELDNNRLVDSATGEKNVFMRRGNEDPFFGALQSKPKRLRFVMDVSRSMSRFNARDRRLDRMAASAVMIMEAFAGFEHKYDYSIVGHDGDSPLISFVEFGRPPSRGKGRLEVLSQMYWNAMFCGSGDHTLAAAHHAIKEVVSEEADDYFVFLLSDANLHSYGINDKTLAAVLLADPRVNTFAIFIAGESDATSLTLRLPLGRAYVCMDTAKLPKIFKDIFTSAVLTSVSSAL